MKTIERIGEGVIVEYQGGDFEVSGRSNAVLSLENISKIAAQAYENFGLNAEEERRLVQFAARIMTAIRFQGGVR